MGEMMIEIATAMAFHHIDDALPYVMAVLGFAGLAVGLTVVRMMVWVAFDS